MSTAIAVAALVRDGRVLMVHRHPDRRWYPDCWDLVGGHIEPGESPERAVIRECLEEVNIRVVELRPMPMTITDSALEIHAFVVDRWDGEPVNAAPDEHDRLGWFGPTELERLKLAHPASRQDILSVTEPFGRRRERMTTPMSHPSPESLSRGGVGERNPAGQAPAEREIVRSVGGGQPT